VPLDQGNRSPHEAVADECEAMVDLTISMTRQKNKKEKLH
jgi:hypothetical protein